MSPSRLVIPLFSCPPANYSATPSWLRNTHSSPSPAPPTRGQLMRWLLRPSSAHVLHLLSISDTPFAHVLSFAFARFIFLPPLHLSTWSAGGSPVLLSLDVISLHLWYFFSHPPNYSYLTTDTSKFKSATLFSLWIPSSQRLSLFQISTPSFPFLSCLLVQPLSPCVTMTSPSASQIPLFSQLGFLPIFQLSKLPSLPFK